MADQTPFPPARGDEATLFRDYNAELTRTLTGAVTTSTPHVIEDAVASAWTRFLQRQPSRDQNWRGWLFRVAQREAWTLEATHRAHESLDEHGRDEGRAMGNIHDRRPDPYSTHLEVGEVFDVLERLPERLRRIALLRAMGMRHKDIGELTGDSPTRVGQLVTRANDHIHDVLEERTQQQADLPKRALRLIELEQRPPEWLVDEIGRPPRTTRRSAGFSEVRRAWRRAALAVDDLRQARASDLARSAEPERRSEVEERADWAVAELRRQRQRDTGRNIGR
jgi:hypothetical protein